MKNRMTVADCRRMVAELQELAVGHWLHNIYDLNNKTFIMKLSVPEKDKVLLLIESGVRFHVTNFKREKSNIPSGFSMKLRKHIRGRKLTAVRQVGLDRVIDFVFGFGDKQHHLIVELYASGNVILTDNEYVILSLLRTHTYDESVRVAVREVYPMAPPGTSKAVFSLPTPDDQALTHDANGADTQQPHDRSSDRHTKPGDSEVRNNQHTDEDTPDDTMNETGSTNDNSSIRYPTNEDVWQAALVYTVDPTALGDYLRKQYDEQQSAAKGTGKEKKNSVRTLKQTLSSRDSIAHMFGSDLLEHCILKSGLKPGEKITDTLLSDSNAIEALAKALQHGPRILASLGAPVQGSVAETSDNATVGNKEVSTDTSDKASAFSNDTTTGNNDITKTQSTTSIKIESNVVDANTKSLLEQGYDLNHKGYILLEPLKPNKEDDLDENGERKRYYSSFQPFRFLQHEDAEFVEYDSFNQAVDEFFSKIEAQRAEKQIASVRDAAMKRVNKIKHDQEKRLDQLEDAVVMEAKKAELVACNLQDVDNAILVVRSAVASGMDWEELSQLVKREKQAENPVASIIHSLKLGENKITLLLWDEDNDDPQQPAVKVDVDINLSAHANMRELYANRKRAAEKAAKTVEQATKAFEDARKKTEKSLQKQQNQHTAIQVSRKVLFFEKFNWFVSSDGYLVLSGRDAQQNELIVKRYLRQSYGDVYVHADLHGASSCVVRNVNPATPIPLDTLIQAGTMTVCRSSAWDAKIITSAWWVHANQVSKTAPSGEYLPTGSFMIRGKKNFLPASRLEMGFGYIFRFDETQLSAEQLVSKREREWRMMASRSNGLAEPSDFKGKTRSKDASDVAAAETGIEHEGETGVLAKGSDHGNVVEMMAEDNKQDGDEDASVLNVKLENQDNSNSDSDDNNSDDNSSENVDDDNNSENDDNNSENDDNNSENDDNNSENDDDDNNSENDDNDNNSENDDDDNNSDSEDDNNNNKDNNDMQSVQSNTSSKKSHLTAKQRRDLRKAKKAAKLGKPVQPNQHQENPNSHNESKKKARKTKGKQNVPLPRGKRSKMKKIAKRYAHQDEEERRLAMLALGNPLKEPKASNEASDGAGDESTEHSSTKAHPKEQSWPNKKPGRKINDDIDPELKEELDGADAVLSFFTAKPDESDGLVHALPFCGPYAAMSHFKYRVKLTPGSMKRGRAVRSAQDLLLKQAKSTTAEKELIKATADPDNMQTIMGGVKISAPGIVSSQKGKKSSKKSGGKRK